MWVFSFDLNWATDVQLHWRTEAGMLFHSLDPATEKARLGNFRFFSIRPTAKSPRVDYRSHLDLEAEHGVTIGGMYHGEVPEWI